MIRRILPVAVSVVLLLMLLAPGCRRTTSGKESWDTGGGKTVVDPGTPILPPADGFAGSAICGDCHREIFNEWAETYHNLSTRETDRPGATGDAIVADADGNGTDDFKDGLDLSTDPDFAAFGADAPKLSFTSGDDFPYKVTIGAVTYDVWRTVGGNGPWRQRYWAQVGLSFFTLPVQYNEKSADWVPYDPDTWYDAGAPRFASADTVKDEIAPGAANDVRCTACHATGFTAELDATGQYTSGYQEITIGCEACHGPSAEHVANGGDTSLVLNPADLLDGSPNGVLAASLTCGRCHIRGHGNEVDGGGDVTLYPWNGAQTFRPGETDLASYFTPTTSAADFWRHKDNPMGAPTPDDPSDDTWIAALEAEMQFIEYIAGPHGPDKPYDPTCFSCHDPHSRAQRHQIRSRIQYDGTTFTGVNQDNNKLCLACHHGHGDWAGLTADDVQGISDTSAPDAVVTAVREHMQDRAAMPIDAANYNPAGTGLGRCTSCHMVATATSASADEDAAGHLLGDIHGHTFKTVIPVVSKLTNPAVANSCSVCHPTEAADPAAIVIEEWATDPDADGIFHASAPESYMTGVANAGRDGGVACVACHTTDGFLAVQVNGTDHHDLTDPADETTRIAMVKEGIAREKGITCEACHGRDPDGNFAVGANPLRFPKEELCGKCHNNQTTLLEDYVATGEIVRHPQRELLAGVDGGEVTGETYSNAYHSRHSCDWCHFTSMGGDAKHDFMPKVSHCTNCHAGMIDFDRGARADYDGSGTTDGIQTEIDGCLAHLQEAILGATTSTGAVITYVAPYFLIDGDRSNTSALDATADAAILRAMFNYNWVSFDASRGIHNPEYALQLIQKSYVEIKGPGTWPGTVR